MTLPRDLGDGLTLRRGRLADADALAEFIADVLRQQDAPEPNHGLGGWTRDLMTGRHPWFRPEDDALIVEDAQGRIVSAGMLITQTLSFAGTIIQAGQPELIGTSNRLSGTGPREDAVRDVPPMERRTRPRDAVHRRHSVVLPAVRLRDGDPAWRRSGDRGRSTPGCAAGRRVSHAALRHGRCGLHRAPRSGGVSAISHLRSARRGVVAIRSRGLQRCECPATDVADRRTLEHLSIASESFERDRCRTPGNAASDYPDAAPADQHQRSPHSSVRAGNSNATPSLSLCPSTLNQGTDGHVGFSAIAGPGSVANISPLRRRSSREWPSAA